MWSRCRRWYERTVRQTEECVGLRGTVRVTQKLVLREEPGGVSVVLEREYLLSSLKGDMAIKSATDKRKCWDQACSQ
jgi:hypothetical protein